MIHEALHAGGGIGRSKGHHLQGIEFIRSSEGKNILRLLILIAHIPVSVGEVNISESGFSSGAFDDGVYTWEREDVLDRNCVDFPIVEYGAEAPVLLFDVEYWGSVRGLRFLDKAGVKLLFDVLGLEFLFSPREWVNFIVDGGRGIRGEVDFMVPWAMGW